MLYDNAQLASVYLAGFQAYGDDRYRQVAEETLDFVARELTDPDGGFYATLDADTAGHEGLFYTWTAEELDEMLGADDAAIAKLWFNVEPGGNFEGRTVLATPRTAADVADRLGITESALTESLARIKQRSARGPGAARAPGSRREGHHRLERSHAAGVRRRLAHPRP